MKVSFCTSCSNRTYQLRQTFERNAQIIATNADTEWVIVNFNSGDDLDGFMTDALPGLPERIVYMRENSGRPWHASVAKNVAHRNASGEVLVNLDCDNFIGESTLALIEAHFLSGGRVLHMWSGEMGDGTGGRIAIASDLYHRLGGYDEAFHPMGYQDFDLLARAAASGFPVTRCGGTPELAIRNSKEESIRHCARRGMSWDDFNRQNRARSLSNIAARRLVANAPRGWASMQVETMRGGRREAGGPPASGQADSLGTAGVPPRGSLLRRALCVFGIGEQPEPPAAERT